MRTKSRITSAHSRGLRTHGRVERIMPHARARRRRCRAGGRPEAPATRPPGMRRRIGCACGCTSSCGGFGDLAACAEPTRGTHGYRKLACGAAARIRCGRDRTGAGAEQHVQHDAWMAVVADLDDVGPARGTRRLLGLRRSVRMGRRGQVRRWWWWWWWWWSIKRLAAIESADRYIRRPALRRCPGTNPQRVPPIINSL